MSTDFEAFRNSVQQQATEIRQDTRSRQKQDKEKVEIIHMFWRQYDAENRRFNTVQAPPSPKQINTTTGGFFYLLSGQGLLTECEPSHNIKEIRDPETGALTGYDVLCQCRFSKVKADGTGSTRDAEAYLEANAAAAWDDESDMEPELRAQLRNLVDADGVVTREIWRPVQINTLVDFTISTFERRRVTSDLKRHNVKGLLPVRQGIPLTLFDAEATVSVDVFIKQDDDAKNTSWHLRLHDPSFRCDSVMPASQEVPLGMARRIKRMLNGNQKFCAPITTVQEGRATIPGNVQFHIVDGEIDLGHGSFIWRTIVKDDDIKSYMKQSDETIRREWIITDRYVTMDWDEQAEEWVFRPGKYPAPRYNLRFSAWDSSCTAFGMDERMWYYVMSENQSLECYVMARYMEGSTMNVRSNVAAAISDAKSDCQGTFHFGVTAVFPAYESWFAKQGSKCLQLAPAEVLDIFKVANKMNPQIFQIHRVEDNDGIEHELIYFMTPTQAENPLHYNGLSSPVICLGSGPRPMLKCADASPLFAENAPVTFYVLLGTKGVIDKADFLGRVHSGSLMYQIFAVQNFSRPTEKKNVVREMAEGSQETAPEEKEKDKK